MPNARLQAGEASSGKSNGAESREAEGTMPLSPVDQSPYHDRNLSLATTP